MQIQMVGFLVQIQNVNVSLILIAVGTGLLGLGYLAVGIKGSEEIEVAQRGLYEVLARGGGGAAYDTATGTPFHGPPVIETNVTRGAEDVTSTERPAQSGFVGSLVTTRYNVRVASGGASGEGGGSALPFSSFRTQSASGGACKFPDFPSIAALSFPELLYGS